MQPLFEDTRIDRNSLYRSADRMRFRIWHLFLFIAISAAACVLIERQVYRTAVLKVETVSVLDDGFFQFGFAVTDGDSPYIQTGVASSKFGENSFLGQQVDFENLNELVGVEVGIRYRDRNLFWLKHQGWGQRLSLEFPDVILWPNAEEWQANRFWKDADHERRKRARLTTQN